MACYRIFFQQLEEIPSTHITEKYITILMHSRVQNNHILLWF
jgi:hypothetical protein